jgi:hypothetical protein
MRERCELQRWAMHSTFASLAKCNPILFLVAPFYRSNDMKLYMVASSQLAPCVASSHGSFPAFLSKSGSQPARSLARCPALPFALLTPLLLGWYRDGFICSYYRSTLRFTSCCEGRQRAMQGKEGGDFIPFIIVHVRTNYVRETYVKKSRDPNSTHKDTMNEWTAP